jgi:hypothetical protein
MSKLMYKGIMTDWGRLKGIDKKCRREIIGTVNKEFGLLRKISGIRIEG